MASLKPFTGTQRSLVLALDFGTTFSGVAYAVLDPQQIPKIQSVTRFPGQENGDFKIPSIVCYRPDGTIRAVGAQARSSIIGAAPEDADLIFVEWFKLYLCPHAMRPGAMPLPPLPRGKSATEVIADFLAYLLHCAREYIQETHANGASLWASVQGRLDIVLSHPNGWEGSQQARMREAAMRAKLVTNDNAGRARLHFVTEGEASLHYCVNSGLASEAIKDGSSVMIVDCGGGTIDLSTYKFMTANPILVEETASPGCILQGSTRVNARFYDFLKQKLSGSDFNTEDDCKAMMERFEKSTKPTFNDPSVRAFIKFGGMRDRDPAFGIRNGQLTVEGADIEKVFQPSVDAIVEAIQTQRRTSWAPVNLAFLVGGFAASPWLYARLRTILKVDGIDLSRPDSHTNKAVSEGAVSFFLTKFVSARISRLTYGVTMNVHWKGHDPQHIQRRQNLYRNPSGSLLLPGGFEVFIAKGTRLEEHTTVRHSYYRESTNRTELDKFVNDVTAYRGAQASPFWVDEDPDSYATLCGIHVDTSGMYKEQRRGQSGAYYVVNYDVVLTVGLTELRAQVTWKENGIDKWSDAEIIFDES